MIKQMFYIWRTHWYTPRVCMLLCLCTLFSELDGPAVVTYRGYTNQLKWGMTVLNGLVIMGQRSSIDWLCVGRWCKEVEGSTFHRINFAPPAQKKKPKRMFPGPPLTWPSPCSPQGSDSARSRALSGLVWYVSICLIWSVHLSGLSGPIRVSPAADLRSHPQLQVAFWELRRSWCRCPV